MKKWKKFLLGWFLLACFVALFTGGGCGYQYKYGNYRDTKTPVYAATTFDIVFMYQEWLGADRNRYNARLLTPLALIDLPLAVVIDTVTLPYDGYIACRNQRAVSFWEKAFKTGVIPANKRFDSYFAKAEWFDNFLSNGIHASPPPSKEVIDSLITLSFKYNSFPYHSYRPLVQSLSQCKSLSAEQIERIYFWEVNENQDRKRADLDALLKLPAMTDELLDKIGQSTNERALLPLLQLERTPLTLKTNLISRLMDSPSSTTRTTVASNTNATPEQLVRLAADQHENVRRKVAHNPKTAPEQLARLISDKHEDVRTAVAVNPNTPPEVLDKLARQQSSFAWLCKNPNTSAETLLFMSNNADKKFHYDIAGHPNVSADVLESMARRHINNPAPNNASIPVLGKIANHANVPMSVLEKLAQHENDNVKESVARNPKASTDVLQLLAENGNSTVRALVVKHPNVTKELVEYCKRQNER